MKLSALQSLFADRVAADSTLAAFGAAFQYDPFVDEQEWNADISARLEEKGVAIEIGYPNAPTIVEAGAGTSFMESSLLVFVSESPVVTHSPTKLALVEKVLGALVGRVGNSNRKIECTSYLPVKLEKGYVLHVLEFTVPVSLP